MSPKIKKILIGSLSFIVIIVLILGTFGYFKCEEIFSYDRWGDFHQCHRKLIYYFGPWCGPTCGYLSRSDGHSTHLRVQLA